MKKIVVVTLDKDAFEQIKKKNWSKTVENIVNKFYELWKGILSDVQAEVKRGRKTKLEHESELKNKNLTSLHLSEETLSKLGAMASKFNLPRGDIIIQLLKHEKLYKDVKDVYVHGFSGPKLFELLLVLLKSGYTVRGNKPVFGIVSEEGKLREVREKYKDLFIYVLRLGSESIDCSLIPGDEKSMKINVENLKDLEKFLQNVSLEAQGKAKPLEEIVGDVTNKKVLLISDIGTLVDKDGRQIVEKLEKKEGNLEKVVITGWDYETAVSRAKEVGASKVLFELGSGLYDFSTKKIEILASEETLNYAKLGNSFLIQEISKMGVYLFSQPDILSFCHYFNPPKGVLEKLKKYSEEKQGRDVSIEKILSYTASKVSAIELEENSAEFSVKKDKLPDVLAEVVRMNGILRPFKPYKLEIKEQEGEVKVRIEFADFDVNYKEISYDELTEVVMKIRERVKEEIANRIWPQKDMCVDIFARPEVSKILLQLGMENFDKVIYLTRAHSHAPIVAECYLSLPPGKFTAICPKSAMTPLLQYAGAIPVCD